MKIRARVKSLKANVVIDLKGKCPRMPTASICGYGAKGSECNLPVGHNGPHVRVDPAEVNVNKLRRDLEVLPSRLDFDEDMPEELTNILTAWKFLGNKPMTALEASLEAFSKGIKFSAPIDDLNALRALYYMGYMIRLEPSRFENFPVIRYKLSKKGLKAVTGTNSEVEEEAITIVKEPAKARVRAKIKTTPTAIKPITKGRLSPPEKTAAKAKLLAVADCGRCEGSGVDSKGNTCKTCKGNGTTTRKG